MGASQKQVGVFLLDRVGSLYEGLEQLAIQNEGIKWVEVHSACEEVVGRARVTRPDVLLLAPQLPGIAEYDLVSSLWRESFTIPVVMSCPIATDEYILLAISLGAASCVTVDTPPESLLRTLRMAGNGEVPADYNILRRVELAPQVRERLQNSPPLPSSSADTCPLTRRERELLQVVSRGYSNQEVGGLLHIQEQTVKNHVSSILRKTHAQGRYQAAATALRNGWIPLT
jgi:DNA-binding NarL/FixJ family response regulator